MSGDRFIWSATKNGEYFLKTGYQWVQSRTQPPVMQHPSSSHVTPSRVWKFIWKLQTPAKICNFMWKTLHGALATMKNLYKRRSSPNPTYPICHNQDELIEHLLLLCLWMETIWFGGILNLKIDRNDVSNWMEWLFSFSNLHVGTNGDRISLLSYVAFMYWHIWKARCNLLYYQR